MSDELPFGRCTITIGSPRDPIAPGIAGVASAVATLIINGYGFVSREDCGSGLLLAATLDEPEPAERRQNLDSLLLLLLRIVEECVGEGFSRSRVLDDVMPVLSVEGARRRDAGARGDPRRDARVRRRARRAARGHVQDRARRGRVRRGEGRWR